MRPVYELSKLWSKYGICLLSAHALAFTDECTHLHLPIYISSSVESNFGQRFLAVKSRAEKRKTTCVIVKSLSVVYALTDHSSRPISSCDITHAVSFVTIWSNQRTQTAIQLFSDSILMRNSLNIYFKFVIKICGKRRGVINTLLGVELHVTNVSSGSWPAF